MERVDATMTDLSRRIAELMEPLDTLTGMWTDVSLKFKRRLTNWRPTVERESHSLAFFVLALAIVILVFSVVAVVREQGYMRDFKGRAEAKIEDLQERVKRLEAR